MEIYIYTFCVCVYFVLYCLAIMGMGKSYSLTNSTVNHIYILNHIYSMAGNSIHGSCVINGH